MPPYTDQISATTETASGCKMSKTRLSCTRKEGLVALEHPLSLYLFRWTATADGEQRIVCVTVGDSTRASRTSSQTPTHISSNVFEYQPTRTPEHAFASFRARQVVICCALQLVSSCSANYVNR